MAEDRCKNWKWRVLATNGEWGTETAQLAVLMDIRDELQRLNDVLHCHNFLSIPFKLDAIKRNTAKPKGKRRTT